LRDGSVQRKAGWQECRQRGDRQCSPSRTSSPPHEDPSGIIAGPAVPGPAWRRPPAQVAARPLAACQRRDPGAPCRQGLHAVRPLRGCPLPPCTRLACLALIDQAGSVRAPAPPLSPARVPVCLRGSRGQLRLRLLPGCLAPSMNAAGSPSARAPASGSESAPGLASCFPPAGAHPRPCWLPGPESIGPCQRLSNQRPRPGRRPDWRSITCP
jgi:hypothetical protein